MKIVQHRLQGDGGAAVAFQRSPNQSGSLTARYLVMHYTAGSSAAGAIATLTNPASRASAHLVIGRDGAVTQLVPFNRIAWHAGRSRWHDLRGLNAHSIGIELDNAGRLERQAGEWRSWFGRTYPSDEVLEAAHKNESRVRGWQLYTAEQLAVATTAARAIVEKYGLVDILGHDDIAPGRKADPGPAFPMNSFKSAVLGRRQDGAEIYETTAYLNIREGPGTGYEKLAASPLAPGTRLNLEARDGSWCSVEVLDANGRPDLTGWVHGNYIRTA